MSGAIQLQVDGAVARLCISNVARHNAMSLSMWSELARLVEMLDHRPEIRVLVLRGDGKKAFVSGADISEFETHRSDQDSVTAYDQAVELAQAALIECRKPVVAAIQGVCIGGGIGLAASCDLRYASADSRFRMPAARMGLGYGLAGMRRIVEIIGASDAADIFYTARTFDAGQARAMGFVHDVYDPGALDGAVDEIVSGIAANAPLSVIAAKRAIRAVGGGPEDAQEVWQAVQRCYASQDYREGRTAFMEKRAPMFEGK